MKQVLSIFLVALCGTLSAQQIDFEKLDGYAPRSIGPAGMSGRITSIDVVRNDPNIMYVGSASGGLWKSTSGGTTWDPVFDDQPTASIGAVAIQQSNPSVVWVGTGEGNPRNSLNGGYGVYKSLDGGATWKSMGLEKTRHIHRIIVHPTDPNTVYVGAIGSPWGEHEERGVYRTRDGGKSWKKVLGGNLKTGVADMVMDPTNPNKIVAALWEHKRDPFFFKSGGPGSGLHITYDGGDTWTQLNSEDNGLPKGELGRIGIAIAPSNPDRIYALIEAEKNALYRTDNGGKNWKKINDKPGIGNRPFYYSEIYVDPSNDNRLYTIFTYVNVSEDGGKNFEELMPAYGVSNGVHPDHHAWYIHPDNPNFMMNGNDGGLNITRDRGETWRFVENIPVGQFYHIAVDNEYPYNVYGGMQDNGSWRGPAYVNRAQGIRNSYWQEISFGDGFDVVPDRDDSRYGWSMSQQGYVSRYDHETGNSYGVRPTHPDPDVLLRFNWNSAINIAPDDNSTLYFGSQFVHRSKDKGLTWDIISPDLTSNDPEQQKQAESGGLTMDATGAENYNTILVIEPTKPEPQTIWVGTDDGHVHITRNGGQDWNEVTKNLRGLPTGSWIVQIKASQTRAGHALLVANDYRRFNFEPYAYRTTNYGKSWERIVDGSDVQSYMLSIIEHPQDNRLVFAGTDDGLYVSLDAAKSWTKWDSEGFPTVPVKDMVIQERENDLVVGTFGRAIWVLDDLNVLMAQLNDKSNKQLKVIPPKDAYLASYQQPNASRFAADAVYVGENRSGGAAIHYMVTPSLLEKKKKKKDEDEQDEEEEDPLENKLKVRIYDNAELIRTLNYDAPKADGLNTVRWYLRRDGLERVGRRFRESDNTRSKPSGRSVLPGTYRVEITYKGNTDSQMITVLDDPRITRSAADKTAIRNAQNQLDQIQQSAAGTLKQLTEIKSRVEAQKKAVMALDKKKYKDAFTDTKELTKKLDELIALYVGKEDKRQGIVRSPLPTVNSRISLAGRYLNSRPAGPTKTETTLIQQARDAANDAQRQADEFLSADWATYKTKMRNLDIDWFALKSAKE